jgi:hypothetical protein
MVSILAWGVLGELKAPVVSEPSWAVSEFSSLTKARDVYLELFAAQIVQMRMNDDKTCWEKVL